MNRVVIVNLIFFIINTYLFAFTGLNEALFTMCFSGTIALISWTDENEEGEE